VRFIKSSVKSSSFRIRLKHLLLLLLRCLLIVLFAFILARPVIKSEHFSAAGRAVVRAVLVLDDSYSMAYRDEGRPRIERAKELALGLMKGFEVGSEVALLTTTSPMGSLTFDLDAVRKQIRETKAQPRKAAVWPALARARAMLAERPERGREVYLFTDLTAPAFAGAGQIGQAFKGEVGLCVIDCGQSAKDNFALTHVAPSRRSVPLGAKVRVTVAGAASGPGGERVVQLFLDGEKVGQKGVPFPPDGQAECEFEFRLTTPGSHRGEVAIAADDALGLDNRRWFTLNAAEGVAALCVNGEPGPDGEDELFYLLHALRPRGLGLGPSIEAAVCTPDQLAQQNPKDWDVVLLCNVASLPARTWQRLAEQVAAGKGLIVFAGDNVSAEAYNSAGAAAVLPVKVVSHVAADPPVRFSVKNAGHPLGAAFENGRNGDLGAPMFTRYVAVARAERHQAAAVPIVLDRAAPGVVTLRYQAGAVAFVAAPADAEWGNFPKCACYVPFVHELIHFVVSRRMETQDVTVGQPATLVLSPAQANATVMLAAPGDRRVRQVPVDPKALTARFRETGQTGHYQWRILSDDGEQARSFAVNLDPGESDLRRLSKQDVAEAFPNTRALVARDPTSLDLAVRETRVGKETYPVLVLALLCLMVFEGFLANRFYADQNRP